MRQALTKIPVRRNLPVDVLTAAEKRISWLFEEFPKLYVAYSGGKDSTVLLYLALAEARRRGRKIGVLFIDWEAQFRCTIEHVEATLRENAEWIEPYWVALPLRTTNACSQIEPEWVCWAIEKRSLWVRDLPQSAISDPMKFPFYRDRMTFEEFIPEFAAWFADGQPAVGLVGIRASESLNRVRTLLVDKETYQGQRWTTKMVGGSAYSAYPIYDWRTQDIWVWHARNPQLPYNRIYDLMHRAGVPLYQMRVCEPYGDEQRRGLWLYHILEPDTWSRVVARVSGASTGALYSREAGNVMGNLWIEKPEHLSWKQYAGFLLDTMPSPTADHYKNKIAIWLRWYQRHGYPNADIPDCQDGDTGYRDMPSWRRVCKVLLKNDYWCKALNFGPTKTAAYGRYQKIMKQRRAEWGLI